MKIFNLTYCFLLYVCFAFGQNTTITGNVYDGTTSAPLSNFTITCKIGTSFFPATATTNVSGAYSLSVPTTSDFHVVIAAQNGKCYREKWTWGRKIIDFHLTACNLDRSRDSIALRSLYDNLNGASWTNPWNTAQPITTWGLVYNAQGGGPIEFVGLDNQNLNGTFPRATTGFGNLRDLFGFQFTGNTNLRGTLPNLTSMKQLDWVKIQDSGMSGDPLSSIAGLKNIEFLRLTFNTSMSVTFPSTISADWRNIYNLQLEGVNLSGTIPTALFALPNLQTVGLGQNKLTGTVPSLASGIGSPIKYLILNDNDLDSLPNLSVSTNLTALGVKGNKLTFDDIIPNISKFNAATVYEGSANSFVYAPQDSFFVDTTYRKVIGDPLSIDLKIDDTLTSNVYTWNKNGVFFRTTITNKLFFASLAATDAGVYTCTVTNINAPLLTLISRRITIQINPATNTCRSRDSLALVNLFNTTGGASWTARNRNGKVSPWNIAQPMTTWYGVALNTEGCLDTLNLENNNLTGSLPSAIGDWKNLKVLNLRINNLTSIPNSIGRLDSVTSLLLATNTIAGAIPDSIGDMKQLLDLELQENLFTGSLPTTFGNLNAVQFQLLVSDNELGGVTGTDMATIFPSASLPPNLSVFLARSVKIKGNIPPYFAKTTLRFLALDDNALTGALPESFKALTFGTGTFEGFSLSGNRIDSLPKFGSQFNVNSEIWIEKNKLTFDDIVRWIKPTNVVNCQNQDSIFQQTTLQGTLGSPLSIDLKIDGDLTSNRYQWFKNGVLYGSVLNVNKLIINSLQTSDSGVWTCQVTNPAVPLLTLYSRKITIQVSTQSCRTRDSLVLVSLYNSTRGTDWTVRDTLGQKSPWVLQTPLTTWFGIKVNTVGCVIGIDLDGVLDYEQLGPIPGNNLVGTIPLLDSLTNLTGLFLNANQLSGSIPNFNLPNLQYLSLGENLLSGNIPNFNLPVLQYLALTVNNLSGRIPDFDKLPLLKALYLIKDNLSGAIPNFINLPKLEIFSCYGNQLSGAIPNFNFLNLQGLILSGNQLSGNIPNFNLPNLNTLFLSNNQLSGCIPTGIKTNCPVIGESRGDVSNNPSLNTQNWANYWNNGEGACTTCATSAISQILNPSICPNQTYRSPSGKTFTTAGTKLDTLKNQSGCDSLLFTINLKIQTPQYQQATTQSVCKGDVYRGKILTRDTLFIDTLRSVALCDSVITTTPLKVNNAPVNNLNLSLCMGGSVTVNGIVYNAAKRTGQQILTAASATGCDSIINISTTFVSNLSAIDDDFTIRDSINTLTFNVLVNDVYSGSVKTTPLSKPPTGQLDTLGIGRFRYSFPPQTNGTTGFNYRLCSVGCPNVCDTATVKITINRPRLSGDVSLGITPNCGCLNDHLIFSELELNPDKFPNNELVIISRWGDVVYKAKPYKNDWTGANDKGEVLPAGTYYYIMRLDLANSKIKTGDVTIYR